MSITTELREWTRTHTVNCSDNRIALVAIADRIDAEHQKALDEWKAEHGQMWLKGYSECHAELMEGNETLASDLERCGWVRLPVDADGAPIHVGDKINVYQAKNVEVVGVGNQVVFTHYYMGDYHRHFAGDCRHHYPPTVEDVLREFALACEDAGNAGPEVERIAAEYAAKLRLAGEDE